MPKEDRLRVDVESAELDGVAWAILRVHGNSTGADSDKLKSVLDPYVWQSQCKVLTRFEDATIVDSTTIGVLVSAGLRARALGGTLRVQFPTALTRRYGLGDDDWGTGIPGLLPRPPGPIRGSHAKRPEAG